MTNKEAYQLIESCLEYDKDMSENPEAYENAIRLAKEVFDKQEPMKPEVDGDFGLCKRCGYSYNSELISDYCVKYCPYCGQKLDWED